MDKQNLDLVVKNEAEWRKYMLERIDSIDAKVDQIDKELQTFKVKVFGFASMFGGGMGLSADYIKTFIFGG